MYRSNMFIARKIRRFVFCDVRRTAVNAVCALANGKLQFIEFKLRQSTGKLGRYVASIIVSCCVRLSMPDCNCS